MSRSWGHNGRWVEANQSPDGPGALSLSCCPGSSRAHGAMCGRPGGQPQLRRGPRTLAQSPGSCHYLGLGVDEQNPVPVDGDEDDVRVGGLRGLLGREGGHSDHSPAWEARRPLPETHARTHVHTCSPRPGRWPCLWRVLGRSSGCWGQSRVGPAWPGWPGLGRGLPSPRRRQTQRWATGRSTSGRPPWPLPLSCPCACHRPGVCAGGSKGQ